MTRIDTILKVEVGVLDEGGSTVWPGGPFEIRVFPRHAEYAFGVLLRYCRDNGEHVAGFRTSLQRDIDAS